MRMLCANALFAETDLHRHTPELHLSPSDPREPAPLNAVRLFTDNETGGSETPPESPPPLPPKDYEEVGTEPGGGPMEEAEGDE